MHSRIIEVRRPGDKKAKPVGEDYFIENGFVGHHFDCIADYVLEMELPKDTAEQFVYDLFVPNGNKFSVTEEAQKEDKEDTLRIVRDILDSEEKYGMKKWRIQTVLSDRFGLYVVFHDEWGTWPARTWADFIETCPEGEYEIFAMYDYHF